MRGVILLIAAAVFAVDPVPPLGDPSPGCEVSDVPEPKASSAPVSRAAKSAAITVDTVEDPLEARSSDCGAATEGAVPPAAGWCSLRGAILLANTFPRKTSVSIQLPAGSIKLSSTLPEIRGVLAIVGASPLPELGSMAKAAPEKIPTPGLKRDTTINGRRKYQMLRSAEGSSLFLKMLDLVNGMATAPTSDHAAGGGSSDIAGEVERARRANGGAISALGELVFHSVGLRRNTADNGGAIYFQGRRLELYLTIVEHNTARSCGGGIYLAGGAQVGSACQFGRVPRVAAAFLAA